MSGSIRYGHMLQSKALLWHLGAIRRWSSNLAAWVENGSRLSNRDYDAQLGAISNISAVRKSLALKGANGETFVFGEKVSDILDYDCEKIYGVSWEDHFEDNDDMDGEEDGVNGDGAQDQGHPQLGDYDSPGSDDEEPEASGESDMTDEEVHDEEDSGDDGEKDDDDEHSDDDEIDGRPEEEAENGYKSYGGDYYESGHHKRPDIATQMLEFMIAPENAIVETRYEVAEFAWETLEQAVEDRFCSGEDTDPNVA